MKKGHDTIGSRDCQLGDVSYIEKAITNFHYRIDSIPKLYFQGFQNSLYFRTKFQVSERLNLPVIGQSGFVVMIHVFQDHTG